MLGRGGLGGKIKGVEGKGVEQVRYYAIAGTCADTWNAELLSTHAIHLLSSCSAGACSWSLTSVSGGS